MKRPKAYDPTQPVTMTAWLSDYGAKRPQPEPMSIIAPSELAAFKFAAEIAAHRGIDLDVVTVENLT